MEVLTSRQEWGAVRRLVASHSRWLEYDRSGLGRSEGRPGAPDRVSAADAAAELDLLLKTAEIKPPYVIVAHSWGGLTSREFLHLRPNDVAGIIFVDANQEKHFYYRQEPLPEIGVYFAPFQLAIHEGTDYVKDILGRDQKLPAAEWERVNSDRAIPLHEATSAAEFRAWKDDGPILAAKKQFETQPLGNCPVCVLRADSAVEHQREYDAGVAIGNGTEEERAACRDLIAHWDDQDIPTQQEMLKLSSVGRFSTVPNSLHCIHMSHPEAVAEGIQWVLDRTGLNLEHK